ncbi:MAG: hypothetical protein ABSG37_03495 [Candidatus Limnocylindrales bacterium]|jgi:hypothetical protein
MFTRRDRRDGADGSDRAPAAEFDATLDELEEDGLDEDLEDQPEDMTADLESQAADYLADNDVWMYGPNAAAVLEILDRLEDLVPDEARPLAEAWLAIPRSDREQARKAARKLAEGDEEIALHLQLVREAVATWMAVTGLYPEFVASDPDWGRTCTQAGEAALDAATAVILEGRIDEGHYEALLQPWAETMADLSAAADAARLQGRSGSEPDADAADAGDAADAADAADAGEDEDDEGAEEGEGEFGPNSDAVEDFLNRLWLLTPEQVGRLVSGWQNTPREDLGVAHESLKALVDEDPDWRDQVRRAQEKLAPWLNAGRIQETSGFLGQTGQGESRKMAGPTLADAVAALVLGDLLEPQDAETLYGPWFNLIGAPRLPDAGEEPAAEADPADDPRAAVIVGKKSSKK